MFNNLNWRDHEVAIARLVAGIAGFGIAVLLLAGLTSLTLGSAAGLLLGALVIIGLVVMFRRRRTVPLDQPALPSDDTIELMTIEEVEAAPVSTEEGSEQLTTAQLSSMEVSSPIWPYAVAVGLAGILLIAALWLVGTVFHYRPLPLVLAILLAIGPPLYYGYMTHREIRNRIPPEEKASIPYSLETTWVRPDKLLWLMGKLIANKRLGENADKIVLAATRKHRAQPILRSIIAGLLGLVLVAILIAAAVAINRSAFGLSAAGGFLAGALLNLAFAVIAVTIGWCGWIWLKWSTWYLLVTDKRVFVIVQWPVWLWWVDGRSPSIASGEIRWCEPKDQNNWLSKSLKVPYGRLDIDSITEHDVDFRDMGYVPWHEDLHEIVQSIRPSRQQL